MHRSYHLNRSLISCMLITVIVLLFLLVPAPFAHANEPVLVKSFQTAYGVNRRDIAVVNGVFFFIADDGIHGAELWRSDGTPDGTRLVKDIRSGAAGADLSWFHVVGNTLFFVADDGVHGHELWRSDGTAEGTFMHGRRHSPRKPGEWVTVLLPEYSNAGVGRDALLRRR
jgi:ELWxxDGT repeat protein